MKKYVIGISPRYILPSETTVKYLKIYTDYINTITSRGFIPLVLLDNDYFNECLARCDGFLIIGGDDIDPTYYGETNELGFSKDIDPVQDEIDIKIINYAIKNKVPTLGICRGLQSLAAFLGGSLHQDINYAQLEHPSENKKHYVTKIASTDLTNLLPDNFLTNTFHHQCINKVPDGFKVIYKNHDVIEGIQHESLPVIAFQWHPERFYTDESKIIFDYFAQKVKEHGKDN